MLIGAKTMIETAQLNPWLNELLEAGLEPDEVRAIIRSFLDTAPALLAEAEEHLDSGNMRDAGRAAHRLVGGSANVGLAKLEIVSRDLEHSCEDADARRAFGLLGAVRNVFEAGERELKVAIAALENG